MQSVLLAIAALACPIGMGAMMWVMMRGQRKNTAGDAQGDEQQQQVEQLRAEIDQLKADRAAQRSPGGQRCRSGSPR